MTTVITANGRPAFVVNVEVFLRRDGRWLLIRRGAAEEHAPGTLAGVGGKVETDGAGERVLEETARREVKEEIGVDVGELTYGSSSFFVTDDGDPVVNVVFRAELPGGAEPVAVSPDEVAGFVWVTLDEAEADPGCPPWVLRGLRSVA
ncbi:NUDIX hydrolase [Nonomuraea sp. SBT364]|uniref:NUDIX hydrolase n=1 Tax=Nonomuraea sp. SBT364 TaxID=1580530 RepID=UPI00066DA506|nr:NUDIX domain-containing protein [Nonomuraea sp. SBT364]